MPTATLSRLWLAFVLVATLGAQTAPESPAPLRLPQGATLPTFRSQTELVTLSFYVVDHHRYVGGLHRDDFVVLVDGKPREISLFEGGGSAAPQIPTVVSLLFDCSGSMWQEDLINPNVFKTGLLDELENVAISIYGFSAETYRLLKPSRDVAEMKKALSGLGKIPPTLTGLQAAIAQVVADPANALPNAQRIIVIFSDGFAGANQDRVIHLANNAGVRLYPIRIREDPASPKEWISPRMTMSRQTTLSKRQPTRNRDGRTGAEMMAQAYLHMGPATNGESFTTYSSGGEFLAQILKEIHERLKAQYTAGVYLPSGNNGTSSHRVRAVLKDGGRGEVRGGERLVMR